MRESPNVEKKCSTLIGTVCHRTRSSQMCFQLDTLLTSCCEMWQRCQRRDREQQSGKNERNEKEGRAAEGERKRYSLQFALSLSFSKPARDQANLRDGDHYSKKGEERAKDRWLLVVFPRLFAPIREGNGLTLSLSHDFSLL